jgi:hypothetical protein
MVGRRLELAQVEDLLERAGHTLAALADTRDRRHGDGDAEHAAEDRRRARDIAQRLGMPGLLASLPGRTDEWTLRRDGPDWLLTAGRERARLRDSRGLHYLQALLTVPGREITALDLAAGGAGLRDTGGGADDAGCGRPARLPATPDRARH